LLVFYKKQEIEMHNNNNNNIKIKMQGKIEYQFILILVFFGTFALAGNSLAADHYVSPTGSGTAYTQASPGGFKAALAHVTAGDTILLMDGTYQDTSAGSTSAFNPSNSGTSSGGPITIKAVNTLSAVINGNSDIVPAIGINGKDYVVIDGLRVTGGIQLYNSDYSVVKNCEVSRGYLQWGADEDDLYFGILLQFSNHSLVQNNYVHDLSVDGDNDHNGGCIMILAGSGTADQNIIEYNTVDGGGSYAYNAFGTKEEI
jgi:hypothetical protein